MKIYIPLLLLISTHCYASESQLSCLLEPSSRVKLSSQVNGVVQKMFVERGQKVQSGQKLVLLHDGLQKSALASAKAKYDFTMRLLQRNKNLLEQKLLSEFEHDELIIEKKLAKIELDNAQEKLTMRMLTSPTDAIVTKLNVNVGEYVGTDEVLELVTLDPLYAEVIMRSDAWGLYKEGMSVEVTITDPIEKNIQGKIKVIDSVIDAASGTFGLRVIINNKKVILPSGVKCNINLISDNI